MEEVKALTTTRYLEQETEFLPWSPQMMTHVQRYERSFARTSTYALLNVSVFPTASGQRVNYLTCTAREPLNIAIRLGGGGG